MARKANKNFVNPDLDRPYKDVGDRIKSFRVDKNLLQTDIVVEGTNIATVGRVENGLRAPSVMLLKFLRETHGADLNWILCGE